jgi:hypothetical protein
VGIAAWLLLSFATTAPDVDVAWTSPMPNPYETLPVRMHDAPLDLEPPPLPESAGARRWFMIEDSGDMMGMSLSPAAVVGLQVDFVGPSEPPQKTTRVTIDPYHPRFLLTTAGLTLRF